jgi:hypothetical protein
MAIVHATGLLSTPTWLVVAELLLIVLLVTFELILYRVSKEIADNDRNAAAKMSVITDMRARLDNLSRLGSVPPELADRLKRVTEEVRYFDKNSSVAADSAINVKIGKLEGLLVQAAGDIPVGADKILDELLALTQVRKREASDSKRGAF